MKKCLLFIGVMAFGALQAFASEDGVGNGQAEGGSEYRPLLEQGKVWKYTLVNWASLYYPTYRPECPVERIRETRLEGYETINGETYMKLNVYYDGSDTPAENNPMYYLKEDTETGIVTFMPNMDFLDWISWEGNYVQEDAFSYGETRFGIPGLLYDFKGITGRNFYKNDTRSETSVELADGTHKCFVLDEDEDNATWSVIEGIGLVSDSNGNGCSHLGVSWSFIPSTPDSYYNSFLYEVVNGNGDVIYTDESHRPGWWKGENGVESIAMTPSVKVTDDGILISDAYDTEACLADIEGRILERRATENGRLEISTSGLAYGVYLLRLGSRSYKIAVR